MSCKVLLRACPMCREPVMFGGGITIEYGSPLSETEAVK